MVGDYLDRNGGSQEGNSLLWVTVMARKPLEGIRCYTDRIKWSKRLLGASRDKEDKVSDENFRKESLAEQTKLRRPT